MTEYYSNKSDFSGQSTSVYSGTTGTGYYGATTSNSNPGTKVTNMLDDISTVTTKVQSEGVSHLYRQTGDAALGTEKSSSTFTNAVDRSQTLLAAAKRIHREIMQNIDSKFVKGLDEAYTSLNDVNGSETTYQTTNMTYGMTKTYQSGYSTAYGSQTKTITVQEHYTLAEILGADSPILAAQDIYTQRLAAIKEMLKTGDNLTAKQIKELKGKSDQELMETFYPTLQSDYEKIKGSSFQEDHKKVLQYLEIGLTVAAGLVAIVATAGTATPAIAAAATAANAYLLGSTAYSVATGETLITGTKLSTEERLWAAADLVATGLSAGSTKILGLAEAGRLSTKAADVVEGSSSLLKVTKHADDVMDAINIGKDVVTGDVQSLVMDAGMVGLSAVVKARNNTTVKTGGDSVNSDYQNYVARKKANGESYLSEADWTQKVSTLSANTAAYSDFKASALESFKGTATDVESNITIETRNAAGDVQRVQVKAIGFDEAGNVRIQDYTTAANGLSVNRQSLLDDLSNYGGTVVGEGKGAFTGGTEIKPGTQIDVVSKQTSSSYIEHVAPEIKQATFDKFDDLVSQPKNDWITTETSTEFKNSFDAYAERAVQEGAVSSKVEFYQMYESRQYTYSPEYQRQIMEPYRQSGASSVVSGDVIKKYTFSADPDDFPSIGRIDNDTSIGNFATSGAEDRALLYNPDGSFKSGEEIAAVKGVSSDTYSSGLYQYEYTPEWVQNAMDNDLVTFVNGDTPGSNPLNIPGAKTWSGTDLSMSESELLMPTIDMRGHSYEDFQTSIAEKGYYEIKNPDVFIPGVTTNQTYPTEGIVRINQWMGGNN